MHDELTQQGVIHKPNKAVSPMNREEKVKVRVNTAEVLRILKQDFEASRRLKHRNDEKIRQWKREYNGEPYGNERKGRSKIIARMIKKQSEWQHASLVDPFVSTSDIIRAKPVTWEDKEISPKVEILLNTQFCRQFDRFNFMNKAIKVLDQEGTCVVRTGWKYKEDIIKEQIKVEQPNPEFIQAREQLAMMQEQMVQYEPIIAQFQRSFT